MPNSARNDSSAPVSVASVLSVYAEPLVRGRRVALVGIDDGALAAQLGALGARLLHVYDPRAPEQLRKGDGKTTVVPFRAGDLGVREGAFDVAIVPDLALLGDAEAALAQVRKLVGTQGTALIACRNAEAGASWLAAPESPAPPAYAEFFDLCSLQFADVRMLGVAPFAAYAVAAFAPEREPAIVFDGSLVETPEAPEWFLAVAAQRPGAALEAYEIVQIARADLAIADAEPATTLKTEVAAIELKLREAEARAGDQYVRAERLANDLRAAGEEGRKLRDRLAKLTQEAENERKLRARSEEELAAARRGDATQKLRERVASLEAELVEARTALASPRPAPVELGKLRDERDAIAQDLAAAQKSVRELTIARDEARRAHAERDKELDAALARGKALEDRIEELLAIAAERDRKSRDAEARIAAAIEEGRAGTRVAAALRAELESLAATHEQDVQALEGALRLAGEELRAARAELGHRERLVRELVARLDDAATITAPLEPTALASSAAIEEELALARRELADWVAAGRRHERDVAELRRAVAEAQRALAEERSKVETMALEAARREAALQSASWKLSEMSTLGTAGEPSTTTASDDLVAMRGEVDALRRALAQEHAQREALEARLAAGRGGDADELARARATLQEREALIAQLAARLPTRS
jgi:chromosome segregation ATPase